MAKLRGTTKGITKERVINIENYELSLFSLVNPSCKGMLRVNPICANVALSTLKELREELNGFALDAREVDCNRVYTNGAELTELEKVVKYSGDGSFYLQRKKDYERMIEQKKLEEVFPKAERENRIRELEQEILKEVTKGATVGKLSKDLKKASEKKCESLRVELNTLFETMDTIDEEYLNSMLYMIADRHIEQVKCRIDFKINYLESAMGEVK